MIYRVTLSQPAGFDFEYPSFCFHRFMPNKSPEPTGIVAVRLSAGVVGLFIFSVCRWLSFFR
jgi:hypothetical protein